MFVEHTAALPTPPPPPPKVRPLGVTILAILQFIGGILALLVGLLFVAISPYIGELFRGAPLPPILQVLLGALGAALIIAGFLGLLVGWGLWTGKSWAWWLVVIFEVLGLLLSLAWIATGDFSSLLGLIIAAVILYYFFKPHVKDFFGVKVSFST